MKRSLSFPFFIVAVGIALTAATTSAQVPSGVGISAKIINTPHNLSASGPGTIKATSEQQVCIFCHTPHAAAQIRPLWNRQNPTAAYRLYTSKSLQALPGQPTGTSKLCLSCHDGTIALGTVLSRQQPIQMSGSMTTIPAGRKSNLGTDLSDDHPISFKYDSTLVGKDPKIKDPSGLPETVKLDANAELQCTTCHEPHDNSRGKFLVMDNSNSQLCNTCHRPGLTTIASHVQCASCHQPHTAPSGPYLLKAAKVTDTCNSCHNGSIASAANIATDIAKISSHDTSPAVNLPDHIPANAHCSDCHEPHTMRTGTAVAPNISPKLGQLAGINSSGAPVVAAQFEYEVCFKCHADQRSVQPTITRQLVQGNTRLEFATTAISFHPVQAAGKNTINVPSLRPPYTTSSIIYCSDCHNSDTSKVAGGSGPSGVHGSNNKLLLVANYSSVDNVRESATAYALCYKCHDRNKIVSENRPFIYHKKHLSEDKATPCSTCHDSHGISSAQGVANRNSHLINFNTSIVRATSTGKLYYEDLGGGHGRCYLTCHGKTHNPLSY